MLKLSINYFKRSLFLKALSDQEWIFKKGSLYKVISRSINNWKNCENLSLFKIEERCDIFQIICFYSQSFKHVIDVNLFKLTNEVHKF